MKTPEEKAREWVNIESLKLGTTEFIHDWPYSTAEEAYLAGHADAQPKWISVDERLPEPWRNVLIGVAEPEKVLAPGYWNDRDKQWLYFWNDKEVPSVTHWMPLPEPPEDTKS